MNNHPTPNEEINQLIKDLNYISQRIGVPFADMLYDDDTVPYVRFNLPRHSGRRGLTWKVQIYYIRSTDTYSVSLMKVELRSSKDNVGEAFSAPLLELVYTEQLVQVLMRYINAEDKDFEWSEYDGRNLCE